MIYCPMALIIQTINNMFSRTNYITLPIIQYGIQNHLYLFIVLGKINLQFIHIGRCANNKTYNFEEKKNTKEVHKKKYASSVGKVKFAIFANL